MRRRGMLAAILAAALSMSAVAQDVTIMSDDFTSGSVALKARVYEVDVDAGWVAPTGAAGDPPSAWTITGTQMENSATNAGNYPDAVPAEGTLVQAVSHGTDTNNTIIISFDYNVAEGDTLYVHLWGLDGTFDMDGQWFINGQGGNGGCTDGTDLNSDDGVDPYDLKDGVTHPALVASAAQALVALTGSGTYTFTNNLADLAIGGISEAGDFEYYLVAFAKTEDGTVGTTAVDNLLLKSTYTAPPPPPPVGIVWENDMSTDPITGPEPNWVVRGGGSGYTIGGGVLTMNASAWSTILDTNPYNEFLGTTKIDLEWRATSYSPETTVPAAGLWCNVDGDAPDYGGIHFDAILLSNDTQIVNIVGGNTDPILATHTGFGPGMLTLSAVIDGYQATVDYIITDGSTSVTNTISYTPLATAGTTIGCTLFTSGASAEVDYVRIEANATPDEVYFVADPAELSMTVVESSATAQDSLDITYNAGTNLDLTITISDESHPGSFSVLSATPQVLVAPGSSTLDFEFDRTVAGLVGGQVATGLVTLAWSEAGGGESGSVVIPISGSVTYAPGQNNGWNGNGDGVNWGDPNNWALDRVPGALAADNPFIQNGSVVTVATNAPAVAVPLPRLVLRDNAAGGSTLNIQADLPAVDSFEVGLNAGFAGFVNHTAGTAEALNLTVGTVGGSGFDSAYDLSGGTINVTGDLTIGDDGVLDINGGAATMGGTQVTGGGLLKLQSGSFSAGEDSSSPAEFLRASVEISGGTFSWLSQVIMNQDAPRDFTIIGDAATVTFRNLQFSAYTGSQGTLKWRLDEDGVSTLKVNSWMHLAIAKIAVDGSAYSGGSQTITLIDSVNMASQPDTNNFTITGFAPDVVAEIVLDTVNHDVLLNITVPGYAGWIPLYGLTGPEAAWDYDADFDDDINWYEYVMGGDPTNPAVKGFVPTGEVVDVGGTDYFEYVYVRRIASGAELDYIPEFATDLIIGDWSGVGVVETGSGALNAEYESVTNQVDMTGVDEGFMHLIVNEL